MLGELGLEQEMEWRQSKTGFYSEGRHVSMSSSLDFLRFPLIGLVDKARLAATILHASRIENWRELEHVPVEVWLRKWSGDRTFEKVWLPLLRSKLGESYRQTSAAFIWATIARLYAARRSGMKQEMFGYLPGGYARLLHAFESTLTASGVEIVKECAVSRVERASGGLLVTQANGVRRHFSNVVGTMASPVAARICSGLSQREARMASGLPYQGIVCASMLVREPLTPYYVTNITDAGLPFTGVIDMSALVDRSEFGGNALVYLPKYVGPDDALFEASDDEIRERFVSGVEQMYRAFDRRSILAFAVSRVRHVFPLPVLGYSELVPPMTTSVPGLYLVNSSHIVNGTLNVNETVGLAEKATERFLAGAARLEEDKHGSQPARQRVA
ncbi:MAG: FAD-dependent oxidoreductase [Bryobacteraceae bacterium]